MAKSFTTIKPGENGFEDVADLIQDQERKSRYDYDALAEHYNKQPIGTIIIIDEDEPMQVHNVRTVLSRRGLVADEPKNSPDIVQDVLVRQPFRDANGNKIPPHERTIVIKKLTNTEMRSLKN